MPLFGSKFSPKKIPNRRSRSLSNLSLDSNQAKEEFGIECGPARLNLGGSEMTFEDGHWVPASGFGAASHQELVILRKKNEQLLNENNFLKVKCETLLDMLTETTVNSHLQIKEISQLKKMELGDVLLQRTDQILLWIPRNLSFSAEFPVFVCR